MLGIWRARCCTDTCISSVVALANYDASDNADRMVPCILVASGDSALHPCWKMLICGGSMLLAEKLLNLRVLFKCVGAMSTSCQQLETVE